MKTRNLLTPLFASVLMTFGAAQAQADNVVTLRVHHFLPPSSNTQVKFLEPWCAKLSAESAGRLKCQIYPAMQMGGTPPQLFDQAKDGVADIVWTVPGYQAGRFLVSEVFELPFMGISGEKSSRALWTYATKNATDEYKGVRPLIFHVISGMALHTTKKQIKTMADLSGMKLRAPTRLATKMVAALGATPVPMPMPLVAESLAKGVIDGAMMPWEVVPTMKAQEIVKYHTETDPSLPLLSTTTFVLAMNPAKYDSLPPELKKVIDANSGADVSAWAGKVWDDATHTGRQSGVDHKNVFYTVPADELKGWQKASESVATEWVKEVSAKGYDGNKLLIEARALLAN
ncbi:TRAP transporter substrate-binding protein [Aromatoleum anaerobium]|uniref:C4-dicarboxylate ABC transporter n=1 Tax=Aromatoleum anaerobium TaxID=182180 RepID=A0ABX1PPA4_9RHOO|nr:TRAP transporter substrate-binding protein [Aromatoleum anaerobium]MCK0506427.1 TRAP transporter substrate-binding protein [Aromatoleum anaerobium]